MNATKLKVTVVGITLVAFVAVIVWHRSRARRSTANASSQPDAAYGTEQEFREQEFRRQFAESAPMRDYGYTISGMRFVPDGKKMVVEFTHADTNARPGWKFVLVADDFGFYHGEAQQPFYTPGTARRPPIHLTATYPPR
jgi:hypothetical protein